MPLRGPLKKDPVDAKQQVPYIGMLNSVKEKFNFTQINESS